jgi:Tol biopolymer transport system component
MRIWVGATCSRSCVSLIVAASLAMCPVARAQGPERSATLPFVSPDGKHIVFVRDLPDKSCDLVVVDADGSNARTLVHDPLGSLMGDWTAGGREVTYVITANDTTTLYRLGLAGGTPVPVTSLVCKGLRLSNDGKRVAFSVGEWTRSRLTVASIDGRNRRAITTRRCRTSTSRGRATTSASR